MIESLQSDITKGIRTCYQEIQSHFTKKNGWNIVVGHFGTFSQDLINSISVGVEEIMISSGDKRTTIKRVFSILIEGLQNIRIHGSSDEHKRQIGFLIIAKNHNNYKVVMANLIKNEDEENLRQYLDKINKLDETELRNLYLEILSMGYLSQKGGAGLGFITMRLKSNEKLDYSFESINDEIGYFAVEVDLLR